MRNHAGRIVGIRTRPMVGDKESDSGTDGTGMFFVPVSIKPDYLLIVEGASDAIAMHDIGFESVIGRSNRNGSTKQIITLRRRLKPKHIIIVPDNDKPGIDGAEELVTMLSMLNQQANLLLLHDHINDVRDCVQTQKNADWLRNRIGESISASPSSEGINQ